MQCNHEQFKNSSTCYLPHMINYLCLRFKQPAQYWQTSHALGPVLLKTFCLEIRANGSCVTLQTEKQWFGNRSALSQGSILDGYWELGALRRNVGISNSINLTSQNSLICHVPRSTRKFAALQEQYVVKNKQRPVRQYLIVPVIQVLISLVRMVNRYWCFAGLTVLD